MSSHCLGKKKKIVILGGGFGGIYTAKHLEKLFSKELCHFEIILVNKYNYFTYQPMLAEVIGGSLGIYDSISSIRSLLKKTTIYIRSISKIDVENKKITLSPNFEHTDLTIEYDALVIAIGTVTDFNNCPSGIKEHSLGFKSLQDAIQIKNRIIDIIETAATEESPKRRKELLTFVVGGGGFSGTEIVAEINDFCRKMIKRYTSISQEDLRVVLVHKNEHLMDKELSPSLSKYTEKLLRKRGIELRLNQSLESATPFSAILNNKEIIPTRTVISTVPSNKNPLLEGLPFTFLYNRIMTNETLQVQGFTDIWAVGDVAAIPSPKSKRIINPPTAQFAVREAKVVAKNIYNSYKNIPPISFSFKGLGSMASLGYHNAVVQLFGHIKLSGFFAWLLWRAVYLFKLPGASRKTNVFLTWTLKLLLPQEPVQLKAEKVRGIEHLHFNKGEIIFNKGDIGDYLYIITKGSVAVLKDPNSQESIATLGPGDYFGEMALLSHTRRNATIQCLEQCDIVSLRTEDFHVLIDHLPILKKELEGTKQKRINDNVRQLEKRFKK